jgi:ABC-2 type transport system permease protein
VRLFWHQLRWEQLVFWRSREAAVFVFLFPLLLFALLTAVYNGRLYGRPAAWGLLAGMLGYGCANTAFAGLALLLISRRELGILKRIRATPLPTATYLTAVLVSIMIVFAQQAASHIVLGRLLKSTPWPGH